MFNWFRTNKSRTEEDNVRAFKKHQEDMSKTTKVLRRNRDKIDSWLTDIQHKESNSGRNFNG